MTTLTPRLLAAAAAALLAAAPFAASAAGGASSPTALQSPKFKKIKLTDQFFSEGANFADLNKDGKQDFFAGPYWYEGPDFVKRHEFYEGKPVDPKGYSTNFVAFAHDFNNDTWPDILVIGFPGQSTGWYENPKGKDGPWERHVAFPITDNESPTFGDLTGDGKPELIFHTKGMLGWATPNPEEPTRRWTFHKASAADQRFQRFTHGLGYGDVNGDGKADLLEAQGWWEQPASLEGDPDWKHHKADFGRGGAQMYAYDMDGDGDNDVITSLQAHGYGLAWFENKKGDNGEITFTRHTILSEKEEEKVKDVQFSQLHAVDLYDMDGDGLKDIVTGKRWWAHGPTGDAQPNAPAVVYWFKLVRKDGKADFIPHLIDNDSGVGTQVVAGDLNGDGLGDVVVGNKKGQFVLIQEKGQGSAAAGGQ